MNAEDADLEARFAAPSDRDLPPGRHELHREILMNHMLNQPPTREVTPHRERRSWRSHGRLLAAVAAGTALAGGVAGDVIAAGDVPTAPEGPRRGGTPGRRPLPHRVCQRVRHCAGDPGREDPRHRRRAPAKATIALQPSLVRLDLLHDRRLLIPERRETLRGIDGRGVDHF